jgi:LCP family protein required for cell wall assembly
MTWQERIPRGRTAWIVAAVVLVLVLGGVGIAFAVSGDKKPTTPQAGATTPAAATPPAAPTPSPTPPPGADIKGPLNLLLVGVDTRTSVKNWRPHSDAILVLHVPEGLDHGYLFSLPRDLLVDVAPFKKANFSGAHIKITESMTYGSRVPGTDKPDPKQGYELLSKTVAAYTGIKSFDAGAILTFQGLARLTDALGGIDLKIDQKVVSKHMRPDGKHRDLQGTEYVGPQMTYQPGTMKLKGWQALDYARQRYTAGGDYTRTRHQRQIIRALLSQVADAGIASDPEKVANVIKAMKDGVEIIGNGKQPADLAYALRGLTPDKITLVDLPGDSVITGGSYKGEQLLQPAKDFLKAVSSGNAETYLAAHPKQINK